MAYDHETGCPTDPACIHFYKDHGYASACLGGVCPVGADIHTDEHCADEEDLEQHLEI